VTYTGDGTEPRNIAHNLGSVPGCMIVKGASAAAGWRTYHRSLGATQYLQLQSTNAAQTYNVFYDTAPTSTVFTVSTDINASGVTYVAYLFAHDAGGFGLTGTDNVISCGSVTLDGSGQGNVNLGYEPQWILYKRTDGAGNWSLVDSMRGWWAEPNQSGATLLANTNNYEAQLGGQGSPASYPKSTGFLISGSSGQSFVYIAIRRGPMKVPTSGTSVFSPVASNASTGTTLTTNFPVDLQMAALRPGNASNTTFSTRLIGINSQNTAVLTPYLVSSSTAAETNASVTRYWINTGFQMPGAFAGTDTIFWNLQRAPSVFDVVCYTGTGSNATFSHNLTVAPEMMIVKRRDTSGTYWTIYHASLGNTQRIFLNTNDIAETATAWNNTTPTTSVFSVGTNSAVNASGSTYVNYLFSSLAGVSKVGSYTGTGALLTVNCGFTSGARFVLIKSTDNYTDWFVYDSARGITSGNDPYLLMNSTAAEVTGTNYVDTDSTGFKVTAAAPAGLNASGGTYIFLAIA
jgi:hypothetical protein